LPRLSDETEVLRKLTEKEAEWCWLPVHAAALACVKEMIVTAPVLAYYDVNKPVHGYSVRASQSGLGAALLQEGRPVAYSSLIFFISPARFSENRTQLIGSLKFSLHRDRARGGLREL